MAIFSTTADFRALILPLRWSCTSKTYLLSKFQPNRTSGYGDMAKIVKNSETHDPYHYNRIWSIWKFCDMVLGHKVAAPSLVPKCFISPIDIATRKNPKLHPGCDTYMGKIIFFGSFRLFWNLTFFQKKRKCIKIQNRFHKVTSYPMDLSWKKFWSQKNLKNYYFYLLNLSPALLNIGAS